MKKVLIGEKTLDRHNEDSYKKLENINLELAELARDHHYYSDDIYMQRFQELDDKIKNLKYRKRRKMRVNLE